MKSSQINGIRDTYDMASAVLSISAIVNNARVVRDVTISTVFQTADTASVLSESPLIRHQWYLSHRWYGINGIWVTADTASVVSESPLIRHQWYLFHRWYGINVIWVTADMASAVSESPLIRHQWYLFHSWYGINVIWVTADTASVVSETPLKQLQKESSWGTTPSQVSDTTSTLEASKTVLIQLGQRWFRLCKRLLSHLRLSECCGQMLSVNYWKQQNFFTLVKLKSALFHTPPFIVLFRVFANSQKAIKIIFDSEPGAQIL